MGTSDSGDSGGSGDPMTSTTSLDSGDSGSETTEGPIACEANWRVTRADGGLNDLAFDPDEGRVYAVGALPTGEAWAMALDSCDGTVLADVTFTHNGADSTRLDGVTLADGDVFVVGSVALPADPRDGLYARLDPSDLSTIWSQSLAGSANQDEVLDITVSASGNLWMAGTAAYDVSAAAWSVNGGLDGSACGFSWAGAGSARGIAVDGDELVVAVRTAAEELVILRYDQSCDCMCQPTFISSPIMVGDDTTNVGDIVVVNGQYYVAGWATDTADPSNIYAQISWVSSMGVLIETYVTDITPDDDGFFDISADDDHLYAVGLHGWTGEPNFVEATALFQAIPLPFGGVPKAEWSASPTDVDTISGVAVDPAADGYLYAGGNIDGDGVLLRCNKQGDCG